MPQGPPYTVSLVLQPIELQLLIAVPINGDLAGRRLWEGIGGGGGGGRVVEQTKC